MAPQFLKLTVNVMEEPWKLEVVGTPDGAPHNRSSNTPDSDTMHIVSFML
jgi:hypothetical protein